MKNKINYRLRKIRKKLALVCVCDWRGNGGTGRLCSVNRAIELKNGH